MGFICAECNRDARRRNVDPKRFRDRNWRTKIERVISVTVRLKDDRIAPEHVALHLDNAEAVLPKLRNYGAAFVGEGAAEVLGEEALPSDRLMRTLGIVEVAQREWERLDPATAEVLEAYARGVNLGLGIAGGPLKSSSPGPFSSSGRSEADWEPVDSLMLSKLVARRRR